MASTPTPSTSSPPPDYWALLPPPHLHSLARAWLAEDSPAPDPALLLVGRTPSRAHLLCKTPGVLAGAPFAQALWEETGCRVTWNLPEGAPLPPGRTLVAQVEGPACGVLQAERVALNVLGRCSGVATAAAGAVKVAKDLGWGGVVAGTRKTTPGFRLAEKYALRVGGAHPHREGLGDGGLLMLKDNHLVAAGAPIEEVVSAARRAGGFTRLLEVECGSGGEAARAAAAGADVILLDNFPPQELLAVAGSLRAAHPRLLLEASGGITPQTLPQFLGPPLDIVSLGGLTHSAPALDFALRLLPPHPQTP